MPGLQITLNADEMQRLMEPVRGQGGFQTLFRRLQDGVNPATRVIEVSDVDLGRIVRHISYRPGGFEDRLSDIFGRSLQEYLG